MKKKKHFSIDDTAIISKSITFVYIVWFTGEDF